MRGEVEAAGGMGCGGGEVIPKPLLRIVVERVNAVTEFAQYCSMSTGQTVSDRQFDGQLLAKQ